MRGMASWLDFMNELGNLEVLGSFAEVLGSFAIPRIITTFSLWEKMHCLVKLLSPSCSEDVVSGAGTEVPS